MQNKKGGFTLIELLVVVLIIGILSAAALPQYEKAVEKSRAAEAITLLKTLREQQALCLLANGENDACFSGGSGNNLFAIADIELKGPSSSACQEPVCGPATKSFSYYVDGQYIGAERMPEYTKYDLETTALFQTNEKVFNRIGCYNENTAKNWCKIIGFTKEENGIYFQP